MLPRVLCHVPLPVALDGFAPSSHPLPRLIPLCLSLVTQKIRGLTLLPWKSRRSSATLLLISHRDHGHMPWTLIDATYGIRTFIGIPLHLESPGESPSFTYCMRFT